MRFVKKLLLPIFVSVLLVFALLSQAPIIQATESAVDKNNNSSFLNKIFKRKQIFLSKTFIKAIDGQTLTVIYKEKIYTVTVTDKTSLKRKFGSKANLTEFLVGHNLQIQGTKTSDTTIDARLIRNLSIQKKRGTFVGVVESVDMVNKKFVLAPVKRPRVTVTIVDTTKIVEREVIKSITDLVVGLKISATGLWDSSNSTLTETTKIVILPSKETTRARANLADNTKITPPSSTPVNISMNSDGFVPSEITIKLGTTVTFTNNDTVAHEPASAPHPTHTAYPAFDAKKDIVPGENWSFVFDKVGSWLYHDHNNAKLFGKIIVTK